MIKNLYKSNVIPRKGKTNNNKDNMKQNVNAYFNMNNTTEWIYINTDHRNDTYEVNHKVTRSIFLLSTDLNYQAII